MDKSGYIYILASQPRGTLYIGVTSDLVKREKQLKRWRRTWKLELIENKNPEWRDLYREIL